ncbi:unnamed protein product [Symbiodinium sp. CCMP2592]|nr:unnamed protein product [Symbiodinium sp. CCMP2592]
MDALACVRREIRRLQEQQRRARVVQARLGLTRTDRLVAVGCYTQSNYNLPLAITFVKQRAPTSWLPSTDTELGEVLENWFLETPEATIVAFEYPETRAQKQLRSRVEKFLAECATVNFIKTCSFTNGYAPSSSEVASQFVETLRGREELATHQGLEHASRWQRRWCSRFRGRWGLRLRSLGPHRDSETDLRAKVSGFWEWCLHLRQTAASYGREPIFINIDESSMPQFCKAKRGVCIRRSDWPAGKVPCGPRKPPRNTATLLAMISSEGTLQKCLPQILIGNERCFPRRLLLSAQTASAATTVQYWRRKSSWVNGPVMVQALEELAKALGPLRLSDSKQIVIVWDCCRVHLTEEVLTACKRLHFWLLFVPTHITSLLQPLDTCVFGPLKQRMRRRYAEAMRGSGCISVAQWLQLLQEVTVTMLSERSWQKSFRSVGISGSAPLSADLQHLGIEYPLPEPGRVLSLTKLLPPGSDSKCELLLNCPRVRFLT